MDVDPAPFLQIIGAIIMWFGLILTISIIKGFIVQGSAIAIAEWLLKISDNASQERICRWLGDKEKILAHLQEIKAKENV
ncbi:hypothetical protein LCGC14_2709310 [marine sediment metagenome]|uniref:MotA/TolQ/ExbB proton channel domain-containing protein n=1 Tax=marine sediment metagenome TaxID=412755 RepID=A0A0F8ZDC6_9ZZZZ